MEREWVCFDRLCMIVASDVNLYKVSAHSIKETKMWLTCTLV